jgi:hypothetical protein
VLDSAEPVGFTLPPDEDRNHLFTVHNGFVRGGSFDLTGETSTEFMINGQAIDEAVANFDPTAISALIAAGG